MTFIVFAVILLKIALGGNAVSVHLFNEASVLLQPENMYTTEPLVDPSSEYFIYTPTAEAENLFLYPLCIGHFRYLPGYHLERNNYDSLLLMYIKQGSCTVRTPDTALALTAGNTVLLNCYEAHAYESSEGWEAYWIHISGIAALKYYDYLSSFADSSVLVLPRISEGLTTLFTAFSNESIPTEAAMSLLLTGMLSEFEPSKVQIHRSSTENDTVSIVTGYIHAHFTESISVDNLANMVHLSRFYFIRLFKRHTGQTPHEYIINTRLNHAKYLLKSTNLSVKEICFASGFSDESRFCTCFRNSVGMRPGEYRG